MILENGTNYPLAPQAFAETAPQFWPSYFVPKLGMTLETAFASYGQLFRTQPWVYTAVKKVSSSIARLGVGVWEPTTSGQQLDNNSPYSQLMVNPCPVMPPYAFWEWTASTIEIYGETYWIKLREGRGNQVSGFVPMHPSLTQIFRDVDGGEAYRFMGRPGEVFGPADVVAFRTFNPDNIMRGISRLEPLRSTLMNEDSSRRAMAAMWKNGARPSGVVSSERELGTDGRERLKAAFQTEHQGTGNLGRVIVLEDGVTYTPTQMDADDMAYIESRKLNREEVAAVMDLPPTAIQILDHATFCLPANAQISTMAGPKPIVDVRSGDQVWAYDGTGLSLSEVTWSGQTGVMPVYTVKTANRTLQATGNHPVLVARRTVKAGKKTWRFGEPEFVYVRVDELKTGDLLVGAHGYASQAKRTHAPNGREVTQGLMEFCGLLMGDGTVNSGNSAGVSIAHAKNARYIDHYLNAAEELFTQRDGAINWRAASDRASRFSSASAARELRELGFGGNAHTKSVPGWVFECSEDMRLAFLRGFIEADGSVNKLGRISFSLCNRQMVVQVRDLMIGLGIPVTNLRTVIADVKLPNGQPFHSTSYMFTASDPASNQWIGSWDPQDAQRMRDGKPFGPNNYRYEDRNGYVIEPPQGAQLTKIVSVTKSDDAVPVYDLEVPATHSFVADGLVVHNSNVTENMRSLYRDSIAPRIEFIESVVNWHVGSDFNGDREMKFAVAEQLRGAFEQRAEALAKLVQAGIAKPAEARTFFDFNDAGPDADKLYANQALQPLGTPVDAPDGQPAIGAGGSIHVPSPGDTGGTDVPSPAVEKYMRDIGSLVGRGKNLQDAARHVIDKTRDTEGVREACEFLIGRRI